MNLAAPEGLAGIQTKMAFIKTNRAESFEPVKVCDTCKQIPDKCSCEKSQSV